MISEGFYSTIPSSYKEGYTSNLETQFNNIEQVDDTNKEIRASLRKYQDKLSELKSDDNDYKDYHSENADNSIYLDYNNRKTTVKDAVKEDIHQMIIQQNNSYIIGMITITTVLITTYLVLRK